MFIKKNHYDNYIQKCRIDLTEQFGLDEEVYITLREPTTGLIIAIQRASEDTEKLYDTFREHMAELIVDHNFYEEEGKKMAEGEVVDILYEKMATIEKIFSEYFNSRFFTQKKKTSRK